MTKEELMLGTIKYLELKIKSRSEPDREHEVVWSEKTEPTCSCPGFQFRHTCAHLKFIDDIVMEINNKLGN